MTTPQLKPHWRETPDPVSCVMTFGYPSRTLALAPRPPKRPCEGSTLRVFMTCCGVVLIITGVLAQTFWMPGALMCAGGLLLICMALWWTDEA